MNKAKIVSLMIISLFIGASMTVSAGEIKNGRIQVTINDDVYGSTSPDIDLPDETNVTFSTIQVTDSGDNFYKVDDNLIIPLDVTCLKEKVYTRKMLRGGLVIAYRNIREITIVGTFKACVHKGKIFGENLNVSDNISIKVNYELTEEQFNSGENMTMYIIALGAPFPGATAPFDWTINLDDMLGDRIIGKIIKEFTDISFVLKLNPVVLAIKQVKLNVDYVISGHETDSGLFTLNATVAAGNGTIEKDPDFKEYKDGIVVNLTAKPDPGFLFDHWLGDDSSNDNPLSVTMISNKTIQAHFKKAPVIIKTTKAVNIGNVKIQIINQKTTNITDAMVNITVKGGIIGRINSTIYDIVNISVNTPVEYTVKSKLFAFGPITITVKVTIETEVAEVVKQDIKAFKIGPIILTL